MTLEELINKKEAEKQLCFDNPPGFHTNLPYPEVSIRVDRRDLRVLNELNIPHKLVWKRSGLIEYQVKNEEAIKFAKLILPYLTNYRKYARRMLERYDLPI